MVEIISTSYKIERRTPVSVLNREPMWLKFPDWLRNPAARLSFSAQP